MQILRSRNGSEARTEAALSQFSATAVENLRPSASGIEVLVRYVTRASERFEMRNRLYQKLLEMLRDPRIVGLIVRCRNHHTKRNRRVEPEVDTSPCFPYL